MPELYSAKNNSVTTIQNCADEPIHIPGSIQPHGFILVFNEKNEIALCSANAGEFLGTQVKEILLQPYLKVLPAALANIVTQYVQTGRHNSQVPFTVFFNDRYFDCFFRRSSPFFILECIAGIEHSNTVYDVLQHTNELVQVVNTRISLQELCQLITKKIHDITGYDRVMVYRFDENYNGDIFAETVVPEHEPFLGLHYPHTDIPAQARALYIRNLMRLIVDVNYEPVPVVTMNQELAQPEKIDMSDLHLRSVSPIHIQYLKNMGVKGTFTISLIKEGRLWGMIACHHYSPKNLSYARQIQAFLQTQILSSQLGVQETAEMYELAASLEPSMRALQEKLSQDGNFIKNYFEKMPEVSSITNASGAAFIDRDAIYLNGITPNQEQIAALHEWLLQKGQQEFHTNKLSKDFPPAKVYEQVASGVLFFKIIHADINISLLFFRLSQDRVIRWGGQPTQKTGIEALTPRNSFATWQQLIQGESLPWQTPEIDAGFRFVHALQQHLFRLFLREEEARVKQLNEKLVRANKELENINWISTHDLKEPLRKISMFASMLEEGRNIYAPQARRPLERIKDSVGRMQKLMDDLLLYSQMSQGFDSFEKVDLNELLAEVEQSFEMEKAEGIYELHAKDLPVVYGNKFQLHQLFVNLLGNAIKFRKPEAKQIVTVAGDKLNKSKITFCDNGIGFSQNLSEKIFQVFQRGHNVDSLGGTGIGLAICRKIMENHNGKIEAVSREDAGACFHLYFNYGIHN
jgi:chemotaxis family two-component system sensor kinase Cph1